MIRQLSTLLSLPFLLAAQLCLAQATLSPMIFPSSRDRIELVGLVQEFQFISPQSIILLDVASTSGASTQWRVTTSAAPELRRFGWTSASLQAGELVHLVGQPKANTPFELSLLELTRANGETLRPEEDSLLDEISPGIWQPVPAQGSIRVEFDHFGFSTGSFSIGSFQAALQIPEEGLESARFELEMLAEDIRGSSPELTQLLKSAAFFDASSFPIIRVVSTGVQRLDENRLQASVEIEVRDRIVRANLFMTVNRVDLHPQTGNPAFGLSGQVSLNRSAFGMSQYLPDVADEIDVHFETELQQQPLPDQPLQENPGGLFQPVTDSSAAPALNP